VPLVSIQQSVCSSKSPADLFGHGLTNTDHRLIVGKIFSATVVATVTEFLVHAAKWALIGDELRMHALSDTPCEP